MAENYQSQLELPRSSGQPHVPSALTVYDPAIQFTQAATTELVAQAKVQEQLDGLTAGETVLQNVFESASAKAQELADPGADPASFDPRQRNADYQKFVQGLLQAATRDAEKIGGTGQKYITYHLGNIVNPALTKFNAEMNKRWNEKNVFDSNQTLTALQTQGRDAKSLDELEGVFARGQDLLGAQVLAGRMTEAEAATKLKALRINTYYDRVMAQAMKEPGKFLLDAVTLSAPEQGIPQEVFDSVYQKVATHYNQLRSMQEHNATKETKALGDARKQNAMVLTSRLDPTMGQTALTRPELDDHMRRGFLDSDDYNRLLKGVQDVRDAGGVGDPSLTARLVKEVELNPFQPIPSVAGLNGVQVAKVYEAQAKAITRRHQINDDVEHPFHSALYKAKDGVLKSMQSMVMFSMERPDAVALINTMMREYETMVGAYYQAHPGQPVPYEDMFQGLMDSFAGPLADKFNVGVDLRQTNRADATKQLQQQLQQIYGDRTLSTEQMNQKAKNIREALTIFSLMPPASPVRKAPQ